jgi:hypothetical protein
MKFKYKILSVLKVANREKFVPYINYRSHEDLHLAPERFFDMANINAVK